MDLKRNLPNANVEFPCIEFTEEGVYEYIIRETSQSGSGWTTDDREYPVTITVTDDGEGHLTADVDYPEGFPEFENKYEHGRVCVTLFANKTAIGAPLVDDKFNFGVFDGETEIVSATNRDRS
ncbi:MAG: hypothetical protein FWC79_04295 [Oscillospiraceae bacterium]|nr:hypothetical protein [Oscillospiraceae bacterium]